MLTNELGWVKHLVGRVLGSEKLTHGLESVVIMLPTQTDHVRCSPEQYQTTDPRNVFFSEYCMMILCGIFICVGGVPKRSYARPGGHERRL